MGKSGTDRAVRPGSIAAIRLSVGAAYPLPDCRRTISRYRLQQTCRIILDDQHLAVNRLQKALSDDMIEEGEQPVVKAKAVEQGARLRMGPKLRPGPDLEPFLERAYPARQRDKAIPQLRHQRLALIDRKHVEQGQSGAHKGSHGG